MNIEKLKIADLKPAEYNPRQATKKQEKELKKSLEKFGAVELIVVNKHQGRENIIVGGHFRIRELQKLGYEEIECVIVDLPLEDEKELNIRLNKNSGEFDFDLLGNYFDTDDLLEWGFEDGELGLSVQVPETEEEQEELNTSTFTIECKKEDKQELIDFIQIKLKESSFENVIIEE